VLDSLYPDAPQGGTDNFVDGHPAPRAEDAIDPRARRLGVLKAQALFGAGGFSARSARMHATKARYATKAYRFRAAALWEERAALAAERPWQASSIAYSFHPVSHIPHRPTMSKPICPLTCVICASYFDSNSQFLQTKTRLILICRFNAQLCC
jgi:hypothetical protein